MPVRTRRSFAARRGGHPRRKAVWTTFNSGALNLASLTTSVPQDVLVGLRTSGASVLGATVIRTHVRLACSHGTADTGPAVQWGLIVMDSTVAAAGKPDPSADPFADWYMLSFLDPGLSQSSVVVSSSILYGESYDIRAKRRLHEMQDQALFTVRNLGSTNLNYTLFIRSLVALP